jgi:hypothetical protein
MPISGNRIFRARWPLSWMGTLALARPGWPVSWQPGLVRGTRCSTRPGSRHRPAAPGAVLMVAMEDNLGAVIIPRLNRPGPT